MTSMPAISSCLAFLAASEGACAVASGDPLSTGLATGSTSSALASGSGSTTGSPYASVDAALPPLADASLPEAGATDSATVTGDDGSAETSAPGVGLPVVVDDYFVASGFEGDYSGVTMVPSMGQAAWTGWYSKLFSYVDTYDVKALCYIDELWSNYGWPDSIWGDSRVETNAYVEQEWLATTGSPRFVAERGAPLWAMLGFAP